LHSSGSEENARHRLGENIPTNIAPYLQIRPVRNSEHLIFNFYHFRFFNSSQNGSAVFFGKSRLVSSLIAVPYILGCEPVFLRKRRYFVKLKNQVAGVFVFHEKPEALYISSLAVAPEYRKQGVAKHILSFATRIANKQGKRWLELTVLKKNTPARLLYEKSGFVKIKEKSSSFVLRKEA
jgi:ribosomal protein S18 acetylase RimI-like enzyme